MIYRVAMNISDGIGKVGFIGDLLPLDPWDKKTSPAIVPFVVGLGITVEKMGKLIAYIGRNPSKSKPFKGFEPWVSKP